MNKELQHIDKQLSQMSILIISLVVSALILSLMLLFTVAKSIDESQSTPMSGVEVSHHSEAITNANKNRERELPVLSHSIY